MTSKKKKYEPKLYQSMRYPGERVQVDVKYVPKACMTKELIERNERYYQCTAIDEYIRQRVIWFAKEHSTYESSKFVEIIVKKFKYKIEEIQIDNGFEFTKRLQYKNNPNRPKTLFEEKLKELNIKYKLIKNYKRKNKATGLVVLWVKLIQAGYKRSITSLYRTLVNIIK